MDIVTALDGTTGFPMHRAVGVERPTDVDDARRLAVTAARTTGFDEREQGRIAIVASEMASNLVKFGERGRLLVRSVIEGSTGPSLEILAVDHGPGMHDADARMVDGVSSAGTLGGGLGAMARLSDLFDLYSLPGLGTVAMSRFWAPTRAIHDEGRFVTGGVAEPIVGEEVTGDAWAVEHRESRLIALLVDGLGHGVDAARAAAVSIDAFHVHHRETPEAIVTEIHRCLRSTRGAAVAVAEVDLACSRVNFCGLGNITATLVRGTTQTNMVSHYGIAGYQARKIQAFEYDWPEDTMLVMHTDGLSARWRLDEYGGLSRHHPALTAATVMRDAARRNDDATVVALRARVG